MVVAAGRTGRRVNAGRASRFGVGDSGAAVADVQRRLSTLGFSTGIDPPARYGAGTRAAVEAFQYRRGLRVDGVCGPQTWSALVEAGRRLGDRFLYRRTPMLRGDDVAELQQRLSALGFDAGRVDGIFGDMTSAALGEFQRNVGLPVDGIAGASTVSELLRFGTRHDDTELVTSVRDRERLRQAPRTLAGRRVAIGEEGGLDATVAGLRRLLVNQGAAGHHPPPPGRIDPGLRGQRRRRRGLRRTPPRLRPSPTARPPTTPATATRPRGSTVGRAPPGRPVHFTRPARRGSRGMSLPLLRETRMPAVICEISPATVRRRAGRGHRPGHRRFASAEWVGHRLGLRPTPPTVDLDLRPWLRP